MLLHAATVSFAQSTAAPRVPATPLPQSQTRVPDLPVESVPLPEDDVDNGDAWLDTGHRNVHALLWRSAMKVDSWFGGQMPAHSYADQTRGSITPVVLWDEFNGFES